MKPAGSNPTSPGKEPSRLAGLASKGRASDLSPNICKLNIKQIQKGKIGLDKWNIAERGNDETLKVDMLLVKTNKTTHS